MCLLIALLAATPGGALAGESICHGSTGNGRLEEGVRLPPSGRNFRVYSLLGPDLGRTWVHSAVRDVVVAAYKTLEETVPRKVFVYGETGWPLGGPFSPHRTHQNGLSVDFMVPALDKEGRSVPLPGGPANQFGYGIEFDSAGRCGDSTIDFEAMGEHLYRLHEAAKARGVEIARVLFDPQLQHMLFRTARGPFLRKNLPLAKGKAWVRHDEHCHVDFAVPCRPLHPRNGGEAERSGPAADQKER